MGKRSPVFPHDTERKGLYCIYLWGSHPDDDGDDCYTGVEFNTREEAEKVFRSTDPFEELSETHHRNHPDGIGSAQRASQSFGRDFAAYYRDTPFLELDGPDIYEVRKLREPKKIPFDDHVWRREQAMQAGMGLGVDAYNDAMGYDLEPPDESED